MRQNFRIWSLIALLATLGAACHDDDNNDPDPDGPDVQKPLVLPTNTRVEKLSDASAILVWDGTSSEYDVEMNSEVVTTKSISCGFKDLQPETTYSWKVRSREGERYSEWVAGPDFTTLGLMDQVKGWPGEWIGSDFRLQLMVLNFKLPVTDVIPGWDESNQKIDVTITPKQGSTDRILFSSSRLQEILPNLPAAIEARVEGDRMSIVEDFRDTLIAPLEYPVSIENLPEEIAEVVAKVIEEVPVIGDMVKDIQINKLGVTLEDFNLRGQMKDNFVKVNFSAGGRFLLETNSELLNVALKVLPLTAALEANMTLSPKETE